ncbi:inositol 1,4,5-triphosphate receptor associated 1 isoform X2 [Brienomyrus brachyistius]|uniref:inositol 1,4,5-triphosphate receptor associated 1 isoform X2 n=1 Tax=Brienomyrus brachyistius TaxID=42636 RepID=UPI0020B44F67|nr:inositol 1,4,5-triphosphate receptor associated 1 isoform X2 [Brienomyrus brachyistius]
MSSLLGVEEDPAGETASTLPAYCRPETKVVSITLSGSSVPLSRQGTTYSQEPGAVEQTRSHRPRISHKSSSGNYVTTLDGQGHVIDLVKDQLPDMQLSEEDKRKNLELLLEAKEVSERFLTRRGRRSTSSISDSPTGTGPTPNSSPAPSRSSSLSAMPSAADMAEANYVSSPIVQDSWTLKEVQPLGPLLPGGSKLSGVSTAQRMGRDSKKTDLVEGASSGARKDGTGQGELSATSSARPGPCSAPMRVPCTAEIKTLEAFPPLMRAASWDVAGSSPELEEEPPFMSELLEEETTPVQPAKMEKLARLREEHKLLRHQSIVGSKLPDLSETAELERGPSTNNESKGQRSEVMPNISDVMLQKLKLHRAQTGSSPPLTEREVENAFVQLLLAFRNDNYTLDTRLHLAERERSLTEENAEKELEDFRGSLQKTAVLWHSAEHRESYQRLLETVAVLHRLSTRLSSRAEMVGAVRQEKRMNKATEVMMQYVENLKRTYEKDHAELMEFKKLANLNSGRGYGASADADDGVPRALRSMSLTMGKAVPRRRVSVAVVPKFNLVSIPGQATVTARPMLPVLCEASNVKVCPPAGPLLQATPAGSRKTAAEPEQETSAPAKPPSSAEEISSEMKAKIEEEAYSKGYQEGLRRVKEMQELEEEEEAEEEKKAEESQEVARKEEEDLEDRTSDSSRFNGFPDVFGRLFPKVLRRKRFIWTATIVLTLLAAALLAFGVFSYFSENQRELPGASSLSSRKKRLVGWNSAQNGSPE